MREPCSVMYGPRHLRDVGLGPRRGGSRRGETSAPGACRATARSAPPLSSCWCDNPERNALATTWRPLLVQPGSTSPSTGLRRGSAAQASSIVAPPASSTLASSIDCLYDDICACHTPVVAGRLAVEAIPRRVQRVQSLDALERWPPGVRSDSPARSRRRSAAPCTRPRRSRCPPLAPGSRTRAAARPSGDADAARVRGRSRRAPPRCDRA